MFLRCFLYKIVRILTDNLNIRVRIEGEFLSRYFDNNRIDINGSNGIWQMEFISDKVYHRSSAESEKKDIFSTVKPCLCECKTHNPMKRSERIIRIFRIQNFFSVYEHYF